jgi:hypothetical protein
VATRTNAAPKLLNPADLGVPQFANTRPKKGRR